MPLYKVHVTTANNCFDTTFDSLLGRAVILLHDCELDVRTSQNMFEKDRLYLQVDTFDESVPSDLTRASLNTHLLNAIRESDCEVLAATFIKNSSEIYHYEIAAKQ